MKQNKVKYIASWATVGKKLNENLPLTNKNTLKSKNLMIPALVTNSSWNCQNGEMKEYNRMLIMRRQGSTKVAISSYIETDGLKYTYRIWRQCLIWYRRMSSKFWPKLIQLLQIDIIRRLQGTIRNNSC